MVINPKTWWKSIVGEEEVHEGIAPNAEVMAKAEQPEEAPEDLLDEESDEEEEFETAYDLDQGSPFRAARPQDQAPVKPPKSIVNSAKEFFLTEIIYRFDVLDDSERKSLCGSYCFELKGQNGGVWTVDIDKDLNVANRKENADSVIQMKQTDFVHLTNGELNPQMAVMASKIKISGDIDKALAINRILVPEAE